MNKEASYQAINVKKNLYETQFDIIVRNNKYSVKSSLVGGFNIYNLLALFATIDFLKIDISTFADFLRIYVSVSGRMNKIIYKNRTIIIDFAHTPSSVNNVLSSLKEFTNHKICVVIGCGGNRDVAKRSIIAKIATKYADKVIFTTDNPRDEEPMDIINQMINNLEYANYEIILDRKEAIYKALSESRNDEVIAILGKGSENHQIINGIYYPFKDKEVVYNWIYKNDAKNTK
jgi:UDP-N-acetylmuramoyl-L-alanyl-D-glutamate--2,6-diaminopimelate ligase